MKKLTLIFVIIGFVILLTPSCNKDKEFCWECTTTYTIKPDPDVEVRCGLTKAGAEHYER